MKMTLLASAAALFVLSTASFASTPSEDLGYSVKGKTTIGDVEAKRRKPRVPGGSGCDSPRDIAEHPECRRADAGEFLPMTVKPSVDVQEARRKPRVKGGSGCDDPRDLIEHPECRADASDILPMSVKPTAEKQEARRKPRVKGGSGCDDPRDLVEHPECRV
jgi:hypothetical protein